MLIFAHRGAHQNYLENSREALLEALKLGCSAVEVDLQLTKDQRVVLIHDLDLKRLFGINRQVKDCRFSEIQGLRNLNGKPGQIIDLAELLRIIPDSVLINLELKAVTWFCGGDLVQAVIMLLRQFQRSKNIIISSFNPWLLIQYHKLDPKARIALLFAKNLRIFKFIIWLTRLQPVAINFSRRFVDAGLVQSMHNLGLAVYVYSVNSTDEYAKFAAMGVDGVFSDCPNFFTT